VTFRWKDYAHRNKKRKITLPAHEFLRRFLLHLLPEGFVRIRHFSFLANRHRTPSIALCRNLIGEEQLLPPCAGTTKLQVRELAVPTLPHAVPTPSILWKGFPLPRYFAL
jgi:hypothetical protein